VNLAITNHRENTLTEKVALTHLEKGRMGAITLRLKQEGMPAIALGLKQASERVFNQ